MEQSKTVKGIVSKKPYPDLCYIAKDEYIGTTVINGEIKKVTYRKQYNWDSGVLTSEGKCINGIPSGFWKCYSDDDGKLYCSGNYLRGERVGLWSYYDKQGNIIFQENFGLKNLKNYNLNW